jgi:hypothetical protein
VACPSQLVLHEHGVNARDACSVEDDKGYKDRKTGGQGVTKIGRQRGKGLQRYEDRGARSYTNRKTKGQRAYDHKTVFINDTNVKQRKLSFCRQIMGNTETVPVAWSR